MCFELLYLISCTYLGAGVLFGALCNEYIAGT
jgi:hypothetical protein